MKTRITQAKGKDLYYIDGDLQKPVTAGTMIVKIYNKNSKREELHILLPNNETGPRVIKKETITRNTKEITEKEKARTVGVCTGEFYDYYYILNGMSKKIEQRLPIISKEISRGKKEFTVILEGKEVKIYRAAAVSKKLKKDYPESFNASQSKGRFKRPKQTINPAQTEVLASDEQTEIFELKQCTAQPEHKDSSLHPVDPDDIFNFTPWPEDQDQSNPKVVDPEAFLLGLPDDFLGERGDDANFDDDLLGSSPVSHTPCEPALSISLPRQQHIFLKTRIAGSKWKDLYCIDGDLQRPVPVGTLIATIVIKGSQNKELRILLPNYELGPKVIKEYTIKRNSKEIAEREKARTVGVCTGEFFDYYYILNGASKKVEPPLPIIWKETSRGKKLTVILEGKEVKIYRAGDVNRKLKKDYPESYNASPCHAFQKKRRSEQPKHTINPAQTEVLASNEQTETFELRPCSAQPEHKDSSIHPVVPDNIFNFTPWPDDFLHGGIEQEDPLTPYIDSSLAAEENPLIDWNCNPVDNVFNFTSRPDTSCHSFNSSANKPHQEVIDLSNDSSGSDAPYRTNFTAPTISLRRQLKTPLRPTLQNNTPNFQQPSSLLKQTILGGSKRPQSPSEDELVQDALRNWRHPGATAICEQKAANLDNPRDKELVKKMNACWKEFIELEQAKNASIAEAYVPPFDYTSMPVIAPSYGPAPGALPGQFMLPPLPTVPGIGLFNPIGNCLGSSPLTLEELESLVQRKL